MAQKTKIEEEFVHLARMALSERTQDVQMFLSRIVRRRSTDKKLCESLIELLRENPTRSTPLRRDISAAMPTDSDTRFHLLRYEEFPHIPFEPIYSEQIQTTLNLLVEEREKIETLMKAGLEPTRTVLFTGPPGVGKTLGSRWIARALGCPLMILDLAAVMSSYLGRTGTNLRHVLEYAKSCNCVLLLDELDAIAKRRDDTGEIGELKRLVTVLLQQLDDWPSSRLLIAATNHADLLDPAIWRRFEQQIFFDFPKASSVRSFLEKLFEHPTQKTKKWIDILSTALAGSSYSDIEREVTLAKRAAVLNEQPLDQHLPALIASDRLSHMTRQKRIAIASQLAESGLVSQRKAQKITGVARDTIRHHLKMAQ
ncbi:MAG: ATP-binding protein [Aestuariivita sp.]|nr:ATP-binding protein [Aestuariivita sp.]